MLNCDDKFVGLSDVRSFLLEGELSNDKCIEISICIPTFNRVETLEKAIESCFKSNTQGISFEVVVIDNNTDSENANLALVRRMNFKYKKNVIYYQNEDNLGMFGNWNRCIQLARGKYISLLHDDDVLLENAFEIWKCVIKHDNGKFGYFKPLTITFDNDDENTIQNKCYNDVNLKVIKTRKFDFEILGNPGMFGAPTSGVLMKKEAAMKCGGYNSAFYPSDDGFYPLRIYSNGYEVLYSRCQCGGYRVQNNASMKLETQKIWMKNVVEFQNELIRRKGGVGFFTQLFKNEELTIYTEEHLKEWCQDNESFLQLLNYSAVLNRKQVKHGIKYISYKVIRKIYFQLFYMRETSI